jgi:hypothetical protein
LFLDDTPTSADASESPQGSYEDGIIAHVQCELGVALYRAYEKDKLPWLEYWGTAVTISITAEEQGGVSPGLSLFTPFSNNVRAFPASQGGNVVTQRSFAVSMGVSGSTTATRSETLQFTWLNHDLMAIGKLAEGDGCSSQQKGIQMEGDLRIAQFIPIRKHR